MCIYSVPSIVCAWRFTGSVLVRVFMCLNSVLPVYLTGSTGVWCLLDKRSGSIWIIQLATLHPRTGFCSPSQHSELQDWDSSGVHKKTIYTKCRIISVCFLIIFLMFKKYGIWSNDDIAEHHVRWCMCVGRSRLLLHRV